MKFSVGSVHTSSPSGEARKKKKEVSEQEDVVLMANAERGLSKSSPISKRIINVILVEEFVLPSVIF